MRLPSLRQANAFFAPLKHKTTTFVVEGREVNLQLAQIILNLASSLKWKVLILDTDALYAANIILVSKKRPEVQKRGVFIRIPTKDSKLEDWLVDSLFTTYELLIVDDLNTLHHLLSSIGARSGSRKLHFIGRALSYLARSDNRTIILTLYKNVMDSTTRGESTRSLSKQSDLVVSVVLHDSFIRFTCDVEKAWAGNLFSVRI